MVRRSAWLAALCLAACGGESAAPSEPSAESESAPAAVTLDPALGRTLNEWIAKDWAAPRTAREEKCDDGKWQGLAPEARRLVLAVRDARFEKKQLLPLDLTGPLTAPKLHTLRDAVALLPPGQAPPSAVTDEIASLGERRFVGVFHVTEHFGADRVFRTDRGRWEWTPGTLVTWLAIHDAATGAVLCQTQLVVKNDTRGAPLAPRLKSDTRQRLTRELGRDVKSEAERALRRITAVLEMPG